MTVSVGFYEINMEKGKGFFGRRKHSWYLFHVEHFLRSKKLFFMLS